MERAGAVAWDVEIAGPAAGAPELLPVPKPPGRAAKVVDRTGAECGAWTEGRAEIEVARLVGLASRAGALTTCECEATPPLEEAAVPVDAPRNH